MVLSPSVNVQEERDSNEECGASDSSIIYRVTFKDATILVGRPASEFSTSSGGKKRHDHTPKDYVRIGVYLQCLISFSLTRFFVSGTGRWFNF